MPMPTSTFFNKIKIDWRERLRLKSKDSSLLEEEWKVASLSLTKHYLKYFFVCGVKMNVYDSKEIKINWN